MTSTSHALVEAWLYMASFLEAFAALIWLVACESSKNVLFIVVDDLRPQLSFAYHQKETLTPNLDQLAREGLVFKRASGFQESVLSAGRLCSIPQLLYDRAPSRHN